MGPAHCRERVQNSVWVAFASIQRDVSHSGGPRAGSGNGTRSSYSLEEGGHRGGPSSRQRFRGLQPILHRSEEGWGVASNSRSMIVEPLSHETQFQDAYYQASRVSNQVRGLSDYNMALATCQALYSTLHKTFFPQEVTPAGAELNI